MRAIEQSRQSDAGRIVDIPGIGVFLDHRIPAIVHDAKLGVGNVAAEGNGGGDGLAARAAEVARFGGIPIGRLGVAAAQCRGRHSTP